MIQEVVNACITAINYAIGFFRDFPEFFLSPVSIIFAMSISQGMQVVWFPQEWSTRKDFQVMSLMDVTLTFAFCCLLWRLIDTVHDRWALVLTVSFMLSMSSILVHYFLFKYLVRKFPFLAPSQENT